MGRCFPSQHLHGLWNAQTACNFRRSKPHGLLTACMQYNETLRRNMSIRSDCGLNLIVGDEVPYTLYATQDPGCSATRYQTATYPSCCTKGLLSMLRLPHDAARCCIPFLRAFDVSYAYFHSSFKEGHYFEF